MKYLNTANHIQGSDQPETLLTLIDLSGSMHLDDIEPSRMEAAIKANHQIVRVKQQRYPHDSIGVIAFRDNAKFVVKPTRPTNIGNLHRIIDDHDLGGSTDFTAPLNLAYDYFSGRTVSPSKHPLAKLLSAVFFEPEAKETTSVNKVNHHTKRIIMLTDGEHLGNTSPIGMADKLKAIGVIIDCIGIGGSPQDIDEAMLKAIASRNPDGTIRYCFIGDQQTLLRKYNALAHHIRPV